MQYNLLKIASLVKIGGRLFGFGRMPTKAVSFSQSLPGSSIRDSAIVSKGEVNPVSFKQTWNNLQRTLRAGQARSRGQVHDMKLK